MLGTTANLENSEEKRNSLLTTSAPFELLARNFRPISAFRRSWAIESRGPNDCSRKFRSTFRRASEPLDTKDSTAEISTPYRPPNENVHPLSLGVRTRAKSASLLRLRNESTIPFHVLLNRATTVIIQTPRLTCACKLRSENAASTLSTSPSCCRRTTGSGKLRRGSETACGSSADSRIACR